MLSMEDGNYSWKGALHEPLTLKDIARPSCKSLLFSCLSCGTNCTCLSSSSQRGGVAASHHKLVEGEEEDRAPVVEMTTPNADDAAGDGAAGDGDNDDGIAGTLRDINLKVRRGELVAIVGMVGSGKSSLLQALLGEMEKRSGRAMLRGSVAYVGQTAFILNATLRENVTFGRPFDGERYRRAVTVCCLQADIDILPGKDETEST